MPNKNKQARLAAQPAKVNKNVPQKKAVSSVETARSKHWAKHWDLAVYLASDNNLILEAIWALTEMQAVSAQLKQVNLKVQFDHGLNESYFDFSQPSAGKLAQLREAAYLPGLLPVKTVVKESENSVSETIRAFLLQLAKDSANKKSDKSEPVTTERRGRGLILSGHSNSDPLTLLPTSNPAMSLSLAELRLLLQEINQRHGGKFDLLGLDSCSLGSIETVFELSEQANYLVAAQGYELNTGWPYRQILAALESQMPAPADAAKLVASEYINFYANYAVAGVSVDMAACDLSRKPQLHRAMKRLVDALLKAHEDEHVETAIIVAHWRSQSYKYELYVDLWDFCYWLARACDNPEIREACAQVQDAVDEMVILNGYCGAAAQHSHGISLYFPWAVRDWMKDRESYQQLLFAFDTQWDDFLDRFLPQTQRGPRVADERTHKKGDPIAWIMPLEGDNAMVHKTNPNERTKTNPNERTKTNPNERTKTNPNERTKTNPNERTKTNPNERTKLSPDDLFKTNPNERTKTNPNERTRGADGGGQKTRAVHVKNPAEIFYRYEDECVLDSES